MALIETVLQSSAIVLTESFVFVQSGDEVHTDLRGRHKDQRRTWLGISICVFHGDGGDRCTCPPWLSGPMRQSRKPQFGIRFLLGQCGSSHLHPSSCPMSWQQSTEEHCFIISNFRFHVPFETLIVWVLGDFLPSTCVFPHCNLFLLPTYTKTAIITKYFV